MWTLSVLMVMASASIVAWSVLSAVDSQADTLRAKATRPNGDATTQPAAPTASIWQATAVWERNLRSPIGTGETAATAAPSEKHSESVAPPSLQLVATAVEGDHPYAVVCDATQHPSVLLTGRSVQGWTVVRIERRRVVLQMESESCELVLPESRAQGTAPVSSSSEVAQKAQVEP